MSPTLRRILAAAVGLIVAVLAGLGVANLVTDEDQPAAPAPRAAPPAALNGPGDLERHTDLRDPPDSLPPAVLERGRELDHHTAERQAPEQTPPTLAAPRSTPASGCRTRLNRNNLSSRTSRILIIVAHRTVSANRPGWGDVDGVAAFLDRPATRASAAAIIDGEGHCLITVRATDKAWHAAAFNNVGYGVELIGNPGDPITGPQWDAFARLVAPIMRANGIPARRATIAGAGVAAGGVTDHRALGSAGGGHYDIKTCPACPRWTVDPLLARLHGSVASSSPLTTAERKLVGRRCYHRRELIAGHRRALNLKWARWYKRVIARRIARIPGSSHHRPARRALLERYRTGAAC